MNKARLITIALLCALFLIPGMTGAKDRDFRGFYDKYKDHENFVALSCKPLLARIFMHNEDREVREFLRSIDHMKMLVFDGSKDSAKYYTNELQTQFLSGRYEDLLVVNEGGERVEFKVHSTGNKISELVMVVSEPGSLVVLYASGDIDVNKIKHLSKSISLKGAK